MLEHSIENQENKIGASLKWNEMIKWNDYNVNIIITHYYFIWFKFSSKHPTLFFRISMGGAHLKPRLSEGAINREAFIIILVFWFFQTVLINKKIHFMASSYRKGSPASRVQRHNTR